MIVQPTRIRFGSRICGLALTTARSNSSFAKPYRSRTISHNVSPNRTVCERARAIIGSGAANAPNPWYSPRTGEPTQVARGDERSGCRLERHPTADAGCSDETVMVRRLLSRAIGVAVQGAQQSDYTAQNDSPVATPSRRSRRHAVETIVT